MGKNESLDIEHMSDKELLNTMGKAYGKAMDDKDNMINHPSHYTFGKIEVIDAIDDWQLGFYEGQVIKYVARAKHKENELQDLKKAQFYLNRLIKKME